MTEDQKSKRERERSFPGLDDEWPYWWIEGDGALLAIVGGADLSAALDIVDRHHEQCRFIIVYVAKLDSFGEVVRDEKRRYAIEGRNKALPSTMKATEECRCCFCGRVLANAPEAMAAVQRPSDRAAETLRCHDECLRPLLHGSRPVAK
jgi:hypothetical protein